MTFPCRRLALLSLFLVSGTSSLMFETLWQRMMILVFGASAPATAAILTAFFLGLAFGSLLGGKLLEWFRSALLFYAIVEMWIGGWSLAVPSLLAQADVFLQAYGDSGTLSLSPSAVRLALSIGSVLPATLGMGATIPVMNRLIHEMGSHVGNSAAIAYGLNTLGAIIGCLLAAFVTIATIGVQNSLYVAIGLNGAVVVGSFCLWLFSKLSTAAPPAPPPARPGIDYRLTGGAVALLTLYFGSGFLALGYEIAWLRILSLYSATSTTTFAVALSTYLLGFASGSLLLFPLLSSRITGVRIFALSNLLAGGSALLMISAAYSFPAIRLSLVFPSGSPEPVSWLRMTSIEFMYAFVLMFLPTLFMGLSFPAVCQALIETREELGRKSGFYYFVGTLGSAVGVVVTGLWLVPRYGLIGTLGAFCTASLLIGAISLTAVERARWRPAAVLVMLGLISGAIGYALWGTPHVRDGKLSRVGDTWEYQPIGPSWHHTSLIRTSRILRYRSGASATVIVKREQSAQDPAEWFTGLYVDDHHVASTRAHSLVDAKMLAHLPLALHPNPRRALTVGFGSGGTSWSMTRYGIDTWAVEIEPEVPRSAEYFQSQNHGILSVDNFRLILNDARNHLYVTDSKYDVISTDVTNLQYRQNSSLYSLEYFQLMKGRLTDDGIACAWIPMNAITDVEFKVLLRTFQKAFPHASLWYLDYTLTNFSILIGTPGPVRWDADRLRRLDGDKSLRQDLADINVESFYQLPLFMYLDPEGYRTYVGEGLIHTDDRPFLEFSSPTSYYNFNVTDQFLERIDGIRALRPASYETFLSGAIDEDLARLKAYDLHHRLWADALRTYHFDWTLRHNPTLFRRRITSQLEKVLSVSPEFAPARELLEKVQ